MPPPTQKGQEMLIGVGDYTIAGYFTENVTIGQTAEVDKVKDDNGATATRIISDPGKTISGRFAAKANAGSPEDNAMETRRIGDTITIDNVGYCIDKWDIARTPGKERAMVDLEASKEDSMTYE